ncbi:MAG: RNA polymerase sigma factor [Duncaniella sp.]|nr:RNA polymerase sigma factor [Duncaniella sp.]MDE6572071.1 RNA polymerase sigma factor [Duncaniella sp.]
MADEKQLDDKDLVARLRDPASCRMAFGDLIREYSEPLYRHIRRMVQSHDDANDLLQNTFMKAWQNIENFRGEAKLSTWLYKIASNEALTHLEKERKRAGISLDDEEIHLAELIASDNNVDGDALALKLRQAVASLPEKQRLVFNMRYYDDMKYEKMSEILGTSVGALKASYHLAVKKIETFFEDHD